MYTPYGHALLGILGPCPQAFELLIIKFFVERESLLCADQYDLAAGLLRTAKQSFRLKYDAASVRWRSSTRCPLSASIPKGVMARLRVHFKKNLRIVENQLIISSPAALQGRRLGICTLTLIDLSRKCPPLLQALSRSLVRSELLSSSEGSAISDDST
jgi:hypothetical protein